MDKPKVAYKNREKQFDTSILALYNNSSDDDIKREKEERKLEKKIDKMGAPKYVEINGKIFDTGGNANVRSDKVGAKSSGKAKSKKDLGN